MTFLNSVRRKLADFMSEELQGYSDKKIYCSLKWTSV